MRCEETWWSEEDFEDGITEQDFGSRECLDPATYRAFGRTTWSAWAVPYYLCERHALIDRIPGAIPLSHLPALEFS